MWYMASTGNHCRSSLVIVDQFKSSEGAKPGIPSILSFLGSRSAIAKYKHSPTHGPARLSHHQDSKWFIAPLTIIAIRPTVAIVMRALETLGLRIKSSLSFAVTRDHSTRFLSSVRFDNSGTMVVHIGCEAVAFSSDSGLLELGS